MRLHSGASGGGYHQADAEPRRPDPWVVPGRRVAGAEGYSMNRDEQVKPTDAMSLIALLMMRVEEGLADPGMEPPDALLGEFQHPPASARPRVWWHWMNGNGWGVSGSGACSCSRAM